ncbi:MAG TPA: porin [Longimicrobiales bacterium]|nr:porin [Longimicrobiales bacterium]
MAMATALWATSLGAQPAPARPDPASWSVWESADGVFRVDLFAGFQALYQLDVPDQDANRLRQGPDFTAPAVGATSLFRVRRARLGLQGHVWTPDLQYHLQAELAGSAATLKRVYLNWRIHGSALQVEAGKFKPPFGRQQLTSYARQQAVDRAVASDEFARGEDDGVMMWGTPFGGALKYYAGVFNGEGNNRNAQQDGDNLFAGRLVWSPLGRVAYSGPALAPSPEPRIALGAAATLNGGWLFDVNGVPGIQGPTESCVAGACTIDAGDDARVVQWAGELAVRWGPLSASGEYFRRTARPVGAALEDLRAEGWYAQAGGIVVPKRLELGARCSVLDTDDRSRAGEIREVTPFASWFARGHDLKLQADFSLRTTRLADGSSLDERRFRSALVVLF